MPQQNRLNLPSVSPRQQAANRLLWNEARSADGADFYTLGYTGRRIEELLNILVSNGVRTLVDIRQNPVSMYRPELSKGNLLRLVEGHGLQYVHRPELGVPRDIRAKAIDTGSRDVIWKWYEEYVAGPRFNRNLHWFFNGLEHPAAFMCVEIDPRECHRHLLFETLEGHGLRGFEL